MSRMRSRPARRLAVLASGSPIILAGAGKSAARPAWAVRPARRCRGLPTGPARPRAALGICAIPRYAIPLVDGRRRGPSVAGRPAPRPRPPAAASGTRSADAYRPATLRQGFISDDCQSPSFRGSVWSRRAARLRPAGEAAEPNTLSPEEVADGWILCSTAKPCLAGAATQVDWQVVDGASPPAKVRTACSTRPASSRLPVGSDFRCAPGGNSGVFLRTPPMPTDVKTCR